MLLTVFGSHLISNPRKKNYGSHPSRGLIEELSKRKFENVDDIVANLLYGDIELDKIIVPAEELYGFASTSREAVKKGANILQQIEPEALFSREEEWRYLESFKKWKEFYTLADDLGAEIIIDLM